MSYVATVHVAAGEWMVPMSGIQEDAMVTCTDTLFHCYSALKVRRWTCVLFSSRLAVVLLV